MEFSKEKSQEIANKLTIIFDLVGELSDEEIAYLDAVAENLQRDISKLEAVAGVLVDLNKAEAKVKLAEQSLNRLRGIRLIHTAMGEYWKINLDYAQKEKKKQELNEAFGL